MKKLSIFIFITILFSFFLYSYRLIPSYFFDSDFARDLSEIFDIAQGKFKLIGPNSSFGGLQTGPYYYYIFVPVFLLTGLNINSVLLMNALLYSLAIGYFFYKAAIKYKLLKAALATASLTLFPLFIFAARNPGNAFTYLPFLLFFLTYLAFNEYEKRPILFFLGFLAGLIMNFHYSSITILIFLSLFILLTLNKKINFAYFLLGFALAFLPLILFEIRHGFIMLNTTFLTKSPQAFLENRQLAGAAGGNKNLVVNFFFISQEVKKYLILNPLLYFILTALLFLKQSFHKKLLFLSLAALASFLFLVIALRYQYAFFYTFPVTLLLFFTFVVLLLESRYFFLLLILSIISVSQFPSSLYGKSTRPAKKFKNAVEYSIRNSLVSKSDKFNIISVRPNVAIAPHGQEYRLFFKMKGYQPDSIFEYNKSEILLVFSEDPGFNLKSLNSWEINQFGKAFIKNREEFSTGSIKIYRITKNYFTWKSVPTKYPTNAETIPIAVISIP